MAIRKTLVAAVVASLSSRVGATDNGLAITPQMGCMLCSLQFAVPNAANSSFQGTIGTRLVVLSQKHFSSRPRN